MTYYIILLTWGEGSSEHGQSKLSVHTRDSRYRFDLAGSIGTTDITTQILWNTYLLWMYLFTYPSRDNIYYLIGVMQHSESKKAATPSCYQRGRCGLVEVFSYSTKCGQRQPTADWRRPCPISLYHCPPHPPQQEGGSSSSSAHLLLRHLMGTGPYLSLQEPVHSTSPQGFLMRTSLVGVPRYTTCRQVRQHRQPGCVSNRPAGLWIHGSSWFVLLANVQLDLGTGLRSSYSRVGLVKGCIDDDYDGVICNKLSPTGD